MGGARGRSPSTTGGEEGREVEAREEASRLRECIHRSNSSWGGLQSGASGVRCPNMAR